MKRKVMSLLAGAVIAGSLLPSFAGAVPVPASKKGDVNGDNQVNVKDVQLILQIIVGRVKPTSQMNFSGDVTGPSGRPDGKLTVQDAMLIAQYVAGLKQI